jgi:hypothetical protein
VHIVCPTTHRTALMAACQEGCIHKIRKLLMHPKIRDVDQSEPFRAMRDRFGREGVMRWMETIVAGRRAAGDAADANDTVEAAVAAESGSGGGGDAS